MVEITLAVKSAPIRSTYLSRESWYQFETGRVVTDLDELLELYKQDGMAQRTIDTKAKDLFEAGFEIAGLPKRKTADIMQFFRRINYQTIGSMLARDALVFGNGFAEIIYENDRASFDSAPVATNISDVVMVSPRHMIIVEDNIPESLTYGEIVGYLSLPVLSSETSPKQLIISTLQMDMYPNSRLIHPGRILHMKFQSLSDSPLGMSALEPCANILRSKIDGDKSLGTIMVRFAKPILDLEVNGGTPEEIKKAGKYASVMNKHPNEVSFFAHDQNLKLDIKGSAGKAIPPRDYMDYLVEQLAVSFGVPKSLVVGTAQGSISGSDLNLVSYFQSLEKDQNIVLTPLTKELMSRYFSVVYNEELPMGCVIKWNRLYKDELATSKFETLGVQNILASYKEGLLPIESTKQRMSEIFEIDYSTKEEDYKKPEQKTIDDFDGKDPQQRTNPFGKKPVDKEPEETE